MITKHLKLQDDGTYKDVIKLSDKMKYVAENLRKAFRSFGVAVKKLNIQMAEDEK